MDFLNWILGALAVATGLSALVVQLRSSLKDATIDQLKESNSAYRERQEQIEAENLALRTSQATLKSERDLLERLKTPPLEELTSLMMKQHTQQQRSTTRLAREVAGLAKSLAGDRKGTR